MNELDKEKFEYLLELICFSHGGNCKSCLFKEIGYCWQNFDETYNKLTTAVLRDGKPALINNLNILCKGDI